MSQKTQSFPQTTCRRCGDCCRKGGPGLHGDDREIIENGQILLSDLFTIRKGEPAWDNIGNHVIRADEDIIKIKNRPRTTTCRFFREADHSCAIYASQPLECRALKCWDTEAIVAVYNKRRLRRNDLLENRKELLELVRTHQETCGYDRIDQLVREKEMSELVYLIRYDMAFRDLAVEKKIMGADLLDFFFGYPLTVTIRRYGLQPKDIGLDLEPKRNLQKPHRR